MVNDIAFNTASSAVEPSDVDVTEIQVPGRDAVFEAAGGSTQGDARTQRVKDAVSTDEMSCRLVQLCP